ncbi:MAG: restriction endonuclease [Saprospiraceae bacterium]
MSEQIFITKASGETVPFSAEKLRRSLRRAGAGEEVMDSIEKEIGQRLYPGITTSEIYRQAFSMLRKASAHLAAKYKLKKALQELGPSGYPFEKYVGEILKHEGYKTMVGQIVQGHCVQHEVDVIASKDDQHFMVECKFHSDQVRKCDVKIPLYIHSRFLDVEKAWEQRPGHGHKFHQGWVVTNTRFTTDATQYGTCTGLNLVSWDFPKKGSLRERIDGSGLHPITCLTTLTKKEKQQLLDKGIVLCQELCQNEKLLKEIGVQPARENKVMEEAKLVCETKIQL